jgi:hypothetical protein
LVDEIEAPEVDVRSRGIFDAGATASPRGRAKNPRQRRSGFCVPDRLAFADEGEVKAPKTDVILGDRLVSQLAIRSLKNFIENM